MEISAPFSGFDTSTSSVAAEAELFGASAAVSIEAASIDLGASSTSIGVGCSIFSSFSSEDSAELSGFSSVFALGTKAFSFLDAGAGSDFGVD